MTTTMKSWTLIGVCALAGAVTMFRRRAGDVGAQAGREFDRCERILKGLNARGSNFR